MFGNRTVSSRLSKARSQAEPGVQSSQSMLLSLLPRWSAALKIQIQIHPLTPQILTLLLLFVELNHKLSFAFSFVVFQLI